MPLLLVVWRRHACVSGRKSYLLKPLVPALVRQSELADQSRGVRGGRDPRARGRGVRLTARRKARPSQAPRPTRATKHEARTAGTQEPEQSRIARVSHRDRRAERQGPRKAPSSANVAAAASRAAPRSGETATAAGYADETNLARGDASLLFEHAGCRETTRPASRLAACGSTRHGGSRSESGGPWTPPRLGGVRARVHAPVSMVAAGSGPTRAGGLSPPHRQPLTFAGAPARQPLTFARPRDAPAGSRQDREPPPDDRAVRRWPLSARATPAA
jgi:hypothetical protein